ncbi:glutathione S-transferase alpha-4-like [Diadema antillarum]|uniref:glutathione S-transferase alpha-4-like n=1 Tax=Diadema antillarum TaxID=105358 RepID=UPI003A875984
MADSKPRLTYTASRGFSSAIRIALAAAKIEYEDAYLATREDFLKLIETGKLMFKQIPLLEIDGKNLIGSDCIIRYVCKKGGLMGKTSDEEIKIEMLSHGARDMLKAGLVMFKFFEPERKDQELQRGLKEARERYLPVFEKTLTDNSSGFLVGDCLSMADIVFYDSVSIISDDPDLEKELANFPKCRAFIEHFRNQPGLKEFMVGPHNFPLLSEKFVQVVKDIFSWV